MPIKTLTLGGLQSRNGELESKNNNKDEQLPGNYTHWGGSVLACCWSIPIAAGEGGIKEVRSKCLGRGPIF